MRGLGQNYFQYQPSTAETVAAQGWATANGYGTVLTPWSLDTDTLSFNVPTTGGIGTVRFGFGAGVFASFAGPGGTILNNVATGAAPPIQPGPVQSAVSPLLLFALAGGALWFLMGKRR